MKKHEVKVVEHLVLAREALHQLPLNHTGACPASKREGDACSCHARATQRVEMRIRAQLMAALSALGSEEDGGDRVSVRK